MFESSRRTHIGLFDYVTSSTLAHIPGDARAPAAPPPGHKSHKNHLSVKSESWRRLENIYQIESFDFAQRIAEWIATHVSNDPVDPEGATAAEKLALRTRRRDGLPRQLDDVVDDVYSLSAAIRSFPLRTAQSLFHLLFPDTAGWCFKRSEAREVDSNIFGSFLWTRKIQDPTGIQAEIDDNALVVACQPPWILSPADFEEFVKCGSLPPFINPGHVYPSELQSRHRLWAKLWDVCVNHKARRFIITSYNMWAFGAFSKGWCTGFISDIWYLDEHSPTVLECITFWMASAMEYDDGYQVPKVPEPVGALRIEVTLPEPHSALPEPTDSESNWEGKSQNAATSAHLTSLSARVSHQGLEDYVPAPVERKKPILKEFIRQWQDSIVNGVHPGFNAILHGSTIPEESFRTFQGEWLI